MIETVIKEYVCPQMIDKSLLCKVGGMALKAEGNEHAAAFGSSRGSVIPRVGIQAEKKCVNKELILIREYMLHVYLTKKYVFLGQIDSSQVLRAKSGSFVAYKRNDTSICRIVNPHLLRVLLTVFSGKCIKKYLDNKICLIT